MWPRDSTYIYACVDCVIALLAVRKMFILCLWDIELTKAILKPYQTNLLIKGGPLVFEIKLAVLKS